MSLLVMWWEDGATLIQIRQTGQMGVVAEWLRFPAGGTVEAGGSSGSLFITEMHTDVIVGFWTETSTLSLEQGKLLLADCSQNQLIQFIGHKENQETSWFWSKWISSCEASSGCFSMHFDVIFRIFWTLKYRKFHIFIYHYIPLYCSTNWISYKGTSEDVLLPTCVLIVLDKQFVLVLCTGGPELQHAGRPGGLLRRHQPIRELREHDHHLLHQGLLLRQAGGREGGGEDGSDSV